MIPLIALSRGPSRDGVFPGGRTGTEGATTTGGRDKRDGADASEAKDGSGGGSWRKVHTNQPTQLNDED